MIIIHTDLPIILACSFQRHSSHGYTHTHTHLTHARTHLHDVIIIIIAPGVRNYDYHACMPVYNIMSWNQCMANKMDKIGEVLAKLYTNPYDSHTHNIQTNYR